MPEVGKQDGGGSLQALHKRFWVMASEHWRALRQAGI